MGQTGPIHFLNLEYFFRIIYDWLLGAHAPTLGPWLTHLWLVVTELAYVAAAVGLAFFVYATMLLYRIRKEEEEIMEEKAEEMRRSAVKPQPTRFEHITELMASANVNDWRQGIIEADVMLDEVLAAQGYLGATLADKLEQAGEHLATINDAWDAHRVRNEIAHQGSKYELTERVARGTIARYESVFHELGVA
ncbi:MAG: hypothetical protein KGI41_01865 [Patescibacteria group bacterium]|nr:hypothetical protein [Patescibacteria group bacterium]